MVKRELLLLQEVGFNLFKGMVRSMLHSRLRRPVSMRRVPHFQAAVSQLVSRRRALKAAANNSLARCYVAGRFALLALL